MNRHALALFFALAVPPVASLAAPHAHEHGAVKLDVAIDGAALTIGLEAPLDSLIGFERAPRNDQERRAADEVLTRLRSGAGLFSADAAAQCTLAKVAVQAPVLDPGTKSSAKTAEAKDEHADLDATFEYKCAQPQLLRTLDVGLFETFKHIQRIDVQVAGPKGQLKSTLKRPARSVPLQR
jgi:hypothetical protein